MAKKSGAVEKLKIIQQVADDAMKLSDYWMVRALRAEGEDIPALPHPTLKKNK